MTSLSLRFLLGGGAFSALAIRGSTPRSRQFLRHHDFRAARSAGNHTELVHEGTHQENPTAGGAQQSFLGELVRNIGKLETRALVQYVNDHLVGGEVNGKVDFFVGALLVPIVKGVDHALAYAHPNAVAVVLA